MNEVIEYFQRDLSEAEARQIVALTSQSFPSSPITLEERLQLILESSTSTDAEQRESKRFVVWENDSAIAHARIFGRQIFVGDQPLNILALASVCTHEKMRGRGFGKLVVKKSFEPVDQGDYRFSLFQTGVPQFYEKLNCRLIENKIVNRKNVNDPEGYPFVDQYVMIYPSHHEWPEGVVDINGNPY